MSAPTVVERWLAAPWPLQGAEPDEDGQDDQAGEGAEDQEQPTGRRAERLARQAAEERATAAEQRVARLQAAEVARVAGQYLAVGTDVLVADLGGVALAELLDEDDNVDVDAVREIAEAIVEARPGLRAARRPQSGSPDGGARQTSTRPPSSWRDVIGAGR